MTTTPTTTPTTRPRRVTLTPERARDLRAGLGATLTREEAARVAGVTTRTVDRWRRDGRIKALVRMHVDIEELAVIREYVVLDTDSVLAMVTVAPAESGEATS